MSSQSSPATPSTPSTPTTPTLTTEQATALEKLKQKIEDAKLNLTTVWDYSDSFLVRFLKARKFDVEKAFEMFSKYVAWREENQVHKITIDDLKEVLHTKTVVFAGEHKSGYPVVMIKPELHSPGTMDYDKAAKLMVASIELSLLELKPGAEGFVLMFDYENWGLKNIDSKIDNMIMHIGQNFYPELLSKAFLVQPPWYFNLAWKVIRPFLDEKTSEKFHFVNDFAELQNHFTKENLISRYGGSLATVNVKDFMESRLKPGMTLGDYVVQKKSSSNPSSPATPSPSATTIQP